MDVIGLDVATDSGRTGIAVGRWEDGRCVLQHVAGSCTSAELAALVADARSPTLLALDAPLGWPAVLAEALVDHRAGMPMRAPRKGMFCRATDRFVHRTLGKRPLDVGADRIAYTAHRALELMAEVGATLAWAPDALTSVHAIEVYPAATLVALGLAQPGYKDDLDLRERILADLPGLVVPAELRSACVASSDALDAVLAVLAGVHFLQGRCYRPDGEGRDLLEREGWIQVLDRSAPMRVTIPGTPTPGEVARERAWRAQVAATVGTRPLSGSVALNFTIAERRTVDLDNLCRPAMAALQDAGVFVRGYANLQWLVARKHRGTPEGLVVELEPAEVVPPGSPELVVDLPGLPPTGLGVDGWKRAATDCVASAWPGPPVDGPVFADIVVPEAAGRSLVDLLKPTLDTLQPFLGRASKQNQEFSPRDEKVVWLRVRRTGSAFRMSLGRSS